MRATDKVTTDYIQTLELDNDHLRAELIAKEQEIISLRQYVEILQRDREFCV